MRAGGQNPGQNFGQNFGQNPDDSAASWNTNVYEDLRGMKGNGALFDSLLICCAIYLMAGLCFKIKLVD
jgi:hypothetical protein